jgi:hypothetical protein
MPILGRFRNNWRKRWVTVREHPTQPLAVISVGRSFSAFPDTFICDEPYASYAYRIENGDWSDYN